MPKSKSRRPPVVVTLTQRLISSNSLPVENTYPAAGAPPRHCAKALRKELETAVHAARLIITPRDSGTSTPAAYLQGVLRSLAADKAYVAFLRQATSPDNAEAIVVRRGLLGSDQSRAALAPAGRKDRCPSGKVPYRSSAKADEDAARLAASTGSPQNSSYHCPVCRWWHLTSRPSLLES